MLGVGGQVGGDLPRRANIKIKNTSSNKTSMIGFIDFRMSRSSLKSIQHNHVAFLIHMYMYMYMYLHVRTHRIQ